MKMKSKKHAKSLKPLRDNGKKSRLPISSDKKKSLRLNLLPKNGIICVAVKSSDGAFKQHWANTRSEAINCITKYNVNGNQVYMSQASFKDDTKRSQTNAQYLRNFFCDIDCGMKDNGEMKAYPSQKAGNKALKKFCKQTKLPAPAVVNSGTGLYAHWPMTTDVPVSTWVEVAKNLKKLVEFYEPGLDADSLIADSARILRPVGSTHRKDQNNPKKVVLLKDCAPIDFKRFKRKIDAAITALPSNLALKEPNITSVSQDTLTQNCSAVVVADNCAVIGNIRDTKGNVAEPLWYAAIGLLRHCKESPAIIHEWSSGHPSYDVGETDRKIEQHSMPPTTCEYFSKFCKDLCQKCPNWEKIKSPILLGISSADQTPQFVLDMNKDHFVSRYASKTVVCRETIDSSLNRQILMMTSFTHFRNFYSNRSVQIQTSKNHSASAPLGDAWLKHEDRRQYEDIQMLPEGNKEGVYNLWRGYSVKAGEGSWKLMRKHIFNVICNGDKKLNRYVLRWLARMIQQPWLPGEVALVLKGNKGVGKGKFVEPFCKLLGQHAMQIFNGKHLTGTFNAHLEDCILLYVDEAYWAGDKSAEGVLKGAITEPILPIERKGFDLRTVRNMLHIIMASNNDWVVPASMDERRYCVLHVSDKHIQDHEYFAAIDEELKHGGLESMLHHLQSLDISEFEVRAVPKTAELIRQKLQSLDPLQEWWFQKLCDGELLPQCGWELVPSNELFDDFINSAQKIGRNIKGYSNTSFGMNISKLLPRNWPKKMYRKSSGSAGRANHYEFPSLKHCRKYFEEKLGVDGLKWDSMSVI